MYGYIDNEHAVSHHIFVGYKQMSEYRGGKSERTLWDECEYKRGILQRERSQLFTQWDTFQASHYNSNSTKDTNRGQRIGKNNNC